MPPTTTNRDDVQPVEHENRDRIIAAIITIVPFLGVGFAMWHAWEGILNWHDLVVFVATYVPVGLGVTVGFHRYLTHRSFKTTRAIRGALAALGSAAIEGPAISWVADHRKHHAFSDREGDPHSPHVGHGGGWWGALKGLFHAHMGWIFIHTQRGLKERYAPDLLRDSTIRFVDRTFVLWAVLGFLFPFGLGIAITGGSIIAGLTGLLWGGLVRVFLVHHVTYGINSLCHFFGRRSYETPDESRNLAWLAPLSFGEAWHNNHHAFPTSAEHGMRWYQIDPSAWVIRALEKLGLAWDVVRIPPERRAARAAALAGAG